MAVNQEGSFETIFIHRQIPVVAGYVQAHPNYPKDRLKLTVKETLDLNNTKVVRLSPAGGASTAGVKHGAQELIEVTGVPAQSNILYVGDIEDARA